jgi:hypothetical protein
MDNYEWYLSRIGQNLVQRNPNGGKTTYLVAVMDSPFLKFSTLTLMTSMTSLYFQGKRPLFLTSYLERLLGLTNIILMGHSFHKEIKTETINSKARAFGIKLKDTDGIDCYLH